MKIKLALTMLLAAAALLPAATAQEKKPKPKPRVPIELDKPALATDLGNVKISGFKVDDMTVEDVFKYLSTEYAKANGKGAGVNFLFTGDKTLKQTKISLDLSAASIPATDVIYYVCLAAGLNHRIDDFAVVIWKLKDKERINRY